MNAAIPDVAVPTNQSQGARMVGRIPVRNLWLLMLYASDLVRLSGEAWIKLEAGSGAASGSGSQASL